MKYLVVLLLMMNLILAKEYKRCQLAKELIWKHNMPLKNIGLLVCIAELRSNLNTTFNKSKSYGLFHLSWCTQNKEGGGCDMNCSDLIDDDITDDVKCVKRILNLVGFKAWGSKEFCNSTSKEIIKECFGNVLDLDKFMDSENKTSKEIETETREGLL
ncbi:unnamed protein product [Diamesa hyperborea]